MITPAGNWSLRICECPMARCIGWWRDAAGSPPISTFDPAIDRPPASPHTTANLPRQQPTAGCPLWRKDRRHLGMSAQYTAERFAVVYSDAEYGKEWVRRQAQVR